MIYSAWNSFRTFNIMYILLYYIKNTITICVKIIKYFSNLTFLK